MDIKTIILLILCIIGIFFIYKEIMLLKKELSFNFIEFSKKNELDMKELRRNTQNDLSMCLNKMRSMNNENIQNILKMNRMAKQPITMYNNHFTDNDNNDDFDETDISDPKLNYMPRPSNIVPRTPASKNTNQDTKSDGSFYMSNNEDNKDDKDNSTSHESMPGFGSNILSKLIGNSKIIGNDIFVVVQDELDIPTNKPNIEIIVSDNSSNLNKAQVITTKISETSEKSNNSKKNPPHVETQENIPHVIPTVGVPLVEAGVNKPPSPLKKEIVEQKIELIESDTETPNYEALLDNMTIGSKKTPNKQDQKLDTLSVSTDNINTINIDNIKSIDNYNLEALKKIAKMHNIGLTVKIDNKWKPLSKSELYNKILEYLKDKKSNH